MGVVFYHLEMGANVYLSGATEVRIFAAGGVGVVLFFVLSGFVIAMAASQRPRGSLSFLLGRLARLYPAYLATAALFVMALWIAPKGALNHIPVVTWDRLWRTLVFDLGRMGGYVYVGWTLFYELCFYLVFALIVARFGVLSRLSWFVLLASLGLLICAGLGWIRIGAFLIGVALFIGLDWILLRPSPLRWAMWPLVGSMLVFGVRSPSTLACASLLVALVLVERAAPRVFAIKPMLWLGDASYSIYLVQVLTNSAALKIAYSLSGGHSLFIPLAMTLGVISTVLAGLAMHRFIEKPGTAISLRWGERLLKSGVAHKD